MACGFTYSNDLEPTASSSSSPFAHSIPTPSTSYEFYGTRSSDPRANMGVLKTNTSYTMAREPIYGDRVRSGVDGGTMPSQRSSYARRSMREVSTRSMYGTPPPSTTCTDCDCESSEYSRSNSRASSAHRQMSFNGNSPKLIIPSRASCNERKQNTMASKPASLVTKVTKVIKKIQRKIGIENGEHGSSTDTSPLRFHHVHGRYVSINQDGTVARRTTGFSNGIVFSNRPIKVNEKVYVKVVDLFKNWDGVLRFGFTKYNPTSFTNGLPEYVIPDLTVKRGFWAREVKSLKMLNHKKDNVAYFYYTAAGDVYYGINGEDKGRFFSGVDTRGPVWVLIDIYGETTGIEFVDPRTLLNNSNSNVSEYQPSHNSSSFSLASHSTRAHTPASSIANSRGDDIAQRFFTSLYPSIVMDVDQFNPLTKGPHAIVDGSIARRVDGEYSNSYVFPNLPLRIGDTLVVFIGESDESYTSSLTFGLTSSSPKEINHNGFPEDAYQMLDRPGYWNIKKDAASLPKSGDVLGFRINPDGKVVVIKNDEPPRAIMHVDTSFRLYPFFDLYGTTTEIHLIGIVPTPNYRPLPAIPKPSSKSSSVSRRGGELQRSKSFHMSSTSQYPVMSRNAPQSISATSCSISKKNISGSTKRELQDYDSLV